MKASDLTVGRNYYLTNRKEQVGTPKDTRYKCVYVGTDIAIFTYEYQGLERPYSVYYDKLDPGTFVLRLHQIAAQG